MTFERHHAHRWDLAPRDAIAVQRELAARVRAVPLTAPPQTIAGLDVSVRGDRVQTAIVVLRLADFAVLDEVVWRGPVAYPYISGLLSFREIPAILPALERLSVRPDVWMTDGQGIAHPRRLGLAAHLGVLLDVPAFGVAKTRLTGTHGALPPEKGAHVPLYAKNNEQIGTVVRTRTGVKPVYVSIGHRITLGEALRLTLTCAVKYKIPEPTRLAHHLSRDAGFEG